MLFINFLCLFYLMVLINGYTISKNTAKRDKFDEIFENVDGGDNTGEYEKYDKTHRKCRKYEKKHPLHATNTKNNEVTFQSKNTGKETSDKHKDVSLWKRLQKKIIKEGKAKEESQRHDYKENKKRIHRHNNKLKYITSHNYHHRNAYKRDELSKRNITISDKDIIDRYKKRKRRNSSYIKSSDRDFQFTKTKGNVLAPETNTFQTSSTVKSHKDIKQILTDMTTDLNYLKNIYEINKEEPGNVLVQDISENNNNKNTETELDTIISPTAPSYDEPDFFGSLQIEAVLENIKMKGLKMMTAEDPAVSEIISNAITETIFQADPLLTHLDISPPHYAYSTSVAKSNDELFKDDIHRSDSTESSLKTTIVPNRVVTHNIHARSLKEDYFTIAQNIENKLQKSFKKTYEKIRKKVTKDFHNEVNEVKSSLKHRIPNKNTKTIAKTKAFKKITKPITKAKGKQPQIHHKTNVRRNKHVNGLPPFQLTTPLSDDYAMLTIFEKILAKTHEDNILKMLATSSISPKQMMEEMRLSKRNAETLTDLSLKEQIEELYDNDIMPEPSKDYNDDKAVYPEETSLSSEVTEETSFEGLSNKLSYNDYVNGYKYYLKFQQNLANENFSDLIRYQAHKHHRVDDIGKFILSKIPQLPGKRYKRTYFDDIDIDEQDLSTKSDDSWFKKHFYFFIDTRPPKKFHTSQTVSLKSPVESVKSTLTSTKKSFDKENDKKSLNDKRASALSSFISSDENAIFPTISRDDIFDTMKGEKVIKAQDDKQVVYRTQSTAETSNGKNEKKDEIIKKYISESNLGKSGNAVETCAYGEKTEALINIFKDNPEQTKIITTTHSGNTTTEYNIHLLLDESNLRHKRKTGKEENERKTNDVQRNALEAKKSESALGDANNLKKSYGYVQVNLVPASTAIVKLIDKPKKGRLRNLINKVRFRKRNKNKKVKHNREKRERIERFSPFKMLKHIFKIETDANRFTQSFENSDFDILTSHIDTFEPVKYNPLSPIDELRKQIPNVTNELDVSLNVKEMPNRMHVRPVYNDNNKKCKYTNYEKTTDSFNTKTAYIGKKNQLSTTTKPWEENSNVVKDINVKLIKYWGNTPNMSSEFTHNPQFFMNIDEIKSDLNKLPSLVSRTYNDTQLMNYVDLNQYTASESLDYIEGGYVTKKSEKKLFPVIKYIAEDIDKKTFKTKNVDNVNPVAERPQFVDNASTNIQEDDSEQLIDRLSFASKSTNLNLDVPVTRRQHTRTYPDYFNDLMIWHNDLLESDNASLRLLWQYPKLTEANAHLYTTPGVKELREQVSFMKENLNTWNSGAGVTEATKTVKLNTDFDDKKSRAQDKSRDFITNRQFQAHNLLNSLSKLLAASPSNKEREYTKHIDNLNDLIRNTAVGVPKDDIEYLQVDTTLMAYDDDMDFFKNTFGDKKLTKNSVKHEKTSMSPLAKMNTPPEQYYSTPVPMCRKDFDKFLKDNELDVASITNPLPKLTNFLLSRKNDKPDTVTKKYNATVKKKYTKLNTNKEQKCKRVKDKPPIGNLSHPKDKNTSEMKFNPEIQLYLDGLESELDDDYDFDYDIIDKRKIRADDYHTSLTNNHKNKRIPFFNRKTTQLTNSKKFRHPNSGTTAKTSDMSMYVDDKYDNAVDLTIINFDNEQFEDKTLIPEETESAETVTKSLISTIFKIKQHSTEPSDTATGISDKVNKTRKPTTLMFETTTKSPTAKRNTIELKSRYIETTKSTPTVKNKSNNLNNYIHNHLLYNHFFKNKIKPTEMCGTSKGLNVIDITTQGNRESTTSSNTKKKKIGRWKFCSHTYKYDIVYDDDVTSGKDMFASTFLNTNTKPEMYNVDKKSPHKNNALPKITKVDEDKLTNMADYNVSVTNAMIDFDGNKLNVIYNDLDEEMTASELHSGHVIKRDSTVKIVEKRNVEQTTCEYSNNTYTAKDVAALEVIVDLIKNEENAIENEKPNSRQDIQGSTHKVRLKSTENHKTTTKIPATVNNIQIHIAIPYVIDRKRSVNKVRVRKVFSAQMSKPVDLEYQIYSFEDTTVIPTKSKTLSTGMYLVVENTGVTVPSGHFTLEPIKLSNVKARQTNITLLGNKLEKTNPKSTGRVPLSKDFISTLVKLNQNVTLNDTSKHNMNTGKTDSLKPNLIRHILNNIKPKRKKRSTKWKQVKKFFGYDKVCNCKCKENHTMCKACAVSDRVMSELIFEFNNLAKYMNDHCTEIQTYFWMNPTGGRRLRNIVHKIDKTLNDYFKKVRGKCEGKSCEMLGSCIDKRSIDNNSPMNNYSSKPIINNMKYSANNAIQLHKNNISFTEALKRKSDNFKSIIFNCTSKSFDHKSYTDTIKREIGKNIYSLDNINVNIICNPKYSTRSLSSTPESSILSEADFIKKIASKSSKTHPKSIKSFENLSSDFDYMDALDIINKSKDTTVEEKKQRKHKKRKKKKKDRKTKMNGIIKNFRKRETRSKQFESPDRITENRRSFWDNYLKKRSSLINNWISSSTVNDKIDKNTADKKVYATITTLSPVLDSSNLNKSLKTIKPEKLAKSNENIIDVDLLTCDINTLLETFKTIAGDKKLKDPVFDITVSTTSVLKPTPLDKHKIKLTEINTNGKIFKLFNMNNLSRSKLRNNNIDSTSLFLSTNLHYTHPMPSEFTNKKSTGLNKLRSIKSIKTTTKRTITKQRSSTKTTRRDQFLNLKSASAEFLKKNSRGNNIIGEDSRHQTENVSGENVLKVKIPIYETGLVINTENNMDMEQPVSASFKGINIENTLVMSTPVPTTVEKLSNTNFNASNVDDAARLENKGLLLSVLRFETDEIKNELHKIVNRLEMNDSSNYKQYTHINDHQQVTNSDNVSFDVEKRKSQNATPGHSYTRNVAEETIFDKIANKFGFKTLLQENKNGASAKSDTGKRENKENSTQTDFKEACESTIRNAKCICDLDATVQHIINQHRRLPTKDFEKYVKNVSCYRYKRTPKYFIIHLKKKKNNSKNTRRVHKSLTYDRNWQWIRNKRSLLSIENTLNNGKFKVDDDVSELNDDLFETFVKDEDGIYRVRNRRKRMAVDYDTRITSKLRDFPSLKAGKDEIYAMINDSITINCLPSKELKHVYQYSWTTERQNMMLCDNIIINGPTMSIEGVQAGNVGKYECKEYGETVRNVKLTVLAVPTYRIVFIPTYNGLNDCTYDEFKALQHLQQSMSKVICGREQYCSVTVHEPSCFIDEDDNSAQVRLTAVLFAHHAEIRCSPQCRRDLQSSIALLLTTNAPLLTVIPVIISKEDLNKTLTPSAKLSLGTNNVLVTRKFKSKESKHRQDYHELASRMTSNDVDIVVSCPAGFYLISSQKICATCPQNTYSTEGDNVCSPCANGSRSEPGSVKCHRVHQLRSGCTRPVCAAWLGVLCVCAARALCASRCRGARPPLRKVKKLRCTGVPRRPRTHPLSPSRVILARLFHQRSSSSKYLQLATDSQETKFEMWKEKNIPPPLPPVDFDSISE